MHETLQLCFKGERDYLQGADICNSLLTALRGTANAFESRPFRLAFHAFSSHQPKLVVNANARLPERLIATFSSGLDNDVQGWLEETDVPVTCRHPYPEADIIACCEVRNERIRTNSPPPFSPVEIAVAMTKALHNHLLPPEGRRWIFSRLALNRLFRDDEIHPVEIQLRQNLNNRLTRSSIRVDDEVLGDIFFSRV